MGARRYACPTALPSCRYLSLPFHRGRIGRDPPPHEAQKSAGPSISVELWKFAPRHLRFSLLAHSNQIFPQAAATSDWGPAIVIMMYKGKKKDPKSPSSYRPISLVNTVYKIYAALLHQRVKDTIDDRISPHQFGFRAGRSTSTPLFIIRRLLEIHSGHGVSFYALFLDWAQAFDSVNHTALNISLQRIGFPDHYVQCIMAIYSNATFRVRDGNVTSKSYPFKRGIRQGCPLSPYVFIIVIFTLSFALFSRLCLPFSLTIDPLQTWIMRTTPSYLPEQPRHLMQFLATQRGLKLNPKIVSSWL